MTKIYLLLFFCLAKMPVPLLAQHYNDVIISEIFADPSPSVGLPEKEFLELYNRSSNSIQLKNWKLMIGNRTVLLPDTVLLSKQYLILCNKNDVLNFLSFGKVCGLSTLVLPNESAVISLYTSQNKLIFNFEYKLSYWRSGQRDGGYSLEMVDSSNPCGNKKNWQVSVNPLGGTPGRSNSVAAINEDVSSPSITFLELLSNRQLIVNFNEKVDSASIAATGNITVPGQIVKNSSLVSPQFNQVLVNFTSDLDLEKSYTLNIGTVADCANNLLRNYTTDFGVPQPSDSGMVVLNEVLFNPKNEGVDFVELYNQSSKFLTIKNWKLGNISNGKISNLKTITNRSVILNPKAYLILSLDGEMVLSQYPNNKQWDFVDLVSMPSFSNTEGTVVILNQKDELMDLFQYSDKMHHAFLHSTEGVSLERINPAIPSNVPENWQSGSALSGYATPGLKNAQQFMNNSANIVQVMPEGISPNGDGYDDVATINLQVSKLGNLANIQIFDIQGRLVKTLAKHLLIGSNDQLIWDGTNGENTLVGTGFYLIVTKIWNANGYAETFSNKIVVAR